MNAAILNREFKHPADGWYHIEPQGEHLNRKAELVQVIDKAACESIVNRFNAAADAGKLSHGHEMLIDHEHFSHDDDKETRAYGWLTRLQNRADGIYGQIRWTTTGKAAVDGGDYRFFSTEYPPEEFEVLNREKTRARPLELSGLTLTNCPNNKGGRPITNRENTLPGNQANSTAGAQADIQNKKSMKQIAQRLGLSADASEEAILGELTKIENRARTAEGALAPLTTERDTLKNRVASLEESQVEADLAAAGIKSDDPDRAALKTGLLLNRESGLAFLKRIGSRQSPQKTQITNRATAQTPAGGKVSTAPVTNRMAEQRAEIGRQKVTNRCSHEEAFNLARAAKPELFEPETETEQAIA